MKDKGATPSLEVEQKNNTHMKVALLLLMLMFLLVAVFVLAKVFHLMKDFGK